MISLNRVHTNKLLVTGHCGLIGRHIVPIIENHGFTVKGLDITNKSGDINNTSDIERAIEGCNGVIHLAAVSRVIWGEQNPEQCWQTNAVASEQLLLAALESKAKPWVIMASSREVYGEPSSSPVSEEMPLLPVNIYGESKLAMEQASLSAREAGLNTAILRLSNVYGDTNDHADRVLPAFCRRAVEGKTLRVDGFDHVFDFTHVSDTVEGIWRLVQMLENGEEGIPPIHLLPGIGTTLLEAAEMAVNAAKSSSEIISAPSRHYDVSRFVGDPSRAKAILGWEAKVSPELGIGLLVEDFSEKLKGSRVA